MANKHYWKYTITDIRQQKTVTGIDLRTLARELGYESCTPFYQRRNEFEIVKEALPIEQIEQPINPERKAPKPPKTKEMGVKTGKSEKKHSSHNCWDIEQFRMIPNVLVCENRCYKYQCDRIKLPQVEVEIRKYLDTVIKKRYLLEMKYDTTAFTKGVKNHIIGFQLVVRFEGKDIKENKKSITPILDEIDTRISEAIKSSLYEEDIDIDDDTDDDQLYSLETSGGEGFYSSII